jgi:hypothetical protein
VWFCCNHFCTHFDAKTGDSRRCEADREYR